MFEIYLDNIKGKSYKELIDVACKYSDKFILVKRDDIEISKNAYKVINILEDSLIEVKEQSQWPGTMLDGAFAKVYYYRIDNNSREVLKKESNALFSWMQPNLLEDLCFLRNDKPWIIVTAHERECYISTEDEYIVDEIINIKGISLKD